MANPLSNLKDLTKYAKSFDDTMTSIYDKINEQTKVINAILEEFDKVEAKLDKVLAALDSSEKIGVKK